MNMRPRLTTLLFLTMACDPAVDDSPEPDETDAADTAEGSASTGADESNTTTTGGGSGSASSSGQNSSDAGDETGDAGDGGESEPQACHATIERGTIALGEACGYDNDCASLVCAAYATFPADGRCEPTPPDCRTRVMGVLRDLVTRQPVANADLSVLGAADATFGALSAPTFLVAQSDVDGKFDVTSDEAIQAFIAIVGLTLADDRLDTVTGISSAISGTKNYHPAIWVREWWSVRRADAQTWSAQLAGDPELTAFLPFDGPGETIGLIRAAGPEGLPLAGARIEPVYADISQAIVRYLDADGVHFNAVETSSNGIFVIFGAGPGERFKVTAEGYAEREPEASRAAAFPDVLFVMAPWMLPTDRH